MTENQEYKVLEVLRFLLSLHRAYDVYDLVVDERFTPTDVEIALKQYTTEED